MDKKIPADGFDDERQAADGPLTQFVDEQTDPHRPMPLERELPRQPEAKPAGRDDYAGGTTEHDDDREM